MASGVFPSCGLLPIAPDVQEMDRVDGPNPKGQDHGVAEVEKGRVQVPRENLSSLDSKNGINASFMDLKWS